MYYACLRNTMERVCVHEARVCTQQPPPTHIYTLGLFRQHHKQLYFQLKFNSVPTNLYIYIRTPRFMVGGPPN